jgi:UDPglucose 6-dehydrogenase
MKLTIIGTGYVGLVTATCLAELGNEVMCVERMQSKLDMLRSGVSPIYEPGLAEMLGRNISGGRMRFSGSVADGVAYSDAVFICVGTPQDERGRAELSQVEEASRQIARSMKGYKLLIEKSTVPVNTYQWVRKTVERYAGRHTDHDVASNPEFLREGSAIADFMNPDRIVVGVTSVRARKVFEDLYRPFIEKGCPMIVTTPATAELTKHASNSFLAMKIAYINMVAELCEKVGGDIKVVADGMGQDPRIGRRFLDAGIGYAGSCLPKDVRAFINLAEEHGADFGILREVERLNAERRKRFVGKVGEILWINKDKNIAVWGLAFKPNTDDIREAPAIDIIGELSAAGARLRLYDPEAEANFRTRFPESDGIRYMSDKYEALRDADALVIITEWDEFKEADMEKARALMRLPIVIDGRNIYEPDDMLAKGFEYYPSGRAERHGDLPVQRREGLQGV